MAHSFLSRNSPRANWYCPSSSLDLSSKHEEVEESLFFETWGVQVARFCGNLMSKCKWFTKHFALAGARCVDEHCVRVRAAGVYFQRPFGYFVHARFGGSSLRCSRWGRFC